MQLTFGRYPSRREMEYYYAREDILNYILDVARVREVILTFKDEPSIHNESQTKPIKAENIKELREYLVRAFVDNLPDESFSYDKSMVAYPSFHFVTKGYEGEPWDFVLEADCRGWRRSFVDVRGAIEFLHQYDVPFIAKFSGHRSLHLIILREALPDELDGMPISDIWKRIENLLRKFFARNAFVSRAHGTGGLLRLAYSLNENTGMVSVPIPYGELDTFRPWEAFHHLVHVMPEARMTNLIGKCIQKRAKTERFIKSVMNEENITPLPRKIWHFSIVEKPAYKKNISEEPSDRAEEIWQHLPERKKLNDEAIQSYKQEDADIRWLIAESLIGDERSSDFLSEWDEYAKCAIEDSIVFLANKSMSFFFDIALKLDRRKLVRSLRSVVEQMGFEQIREELFYRIEISDANESKQLMAFASMASSVFNDWELHENMSEEIQKRFPGVLDEIEQKAFAAFKRLDSGDIEEIREAQRVLLESGKGVSEQIELYMESNNHMVRKRLMEVILKMNDPDLIECIVNAMDDDSRRVRSLAMSALIRFGEKAVPMVEEAARTDNPRLRACALRVLTIVEGQQALDTALEALKSTNIKVRIASIKSLRRIDDIRSIQALKSALWDIAPRVALSAAEALADFSDKGKNTLMDALLQAREEQNNQTLRCIAHGLSELGDDSGLEYLISALNDDKWQEWETPWTLAEMKNPEALESLIEYLRKNLLEGQDSPKHKVRNAIKALSKSRDTRIIKIIREAVKVQQDTKVLKECIKSLYTRISYLGEKDSLQILINIVKMERHPISQWARNAIADAVDGWRNEIEKAFRDMEKGSKSYRLMESVLLPPRGGGADDHNSRQ